MCIRDSVLLCCTALYRDYGKNIRRYIFKEKERSVMFLFPMELVTFPLNLGFLLMGQFLPSVFNQLENLMITKHLKNTLLLPREVAVILANRRQQTRYWQLPESSLQHQV
eukprot:TRINITY_DN16605_c0_g1_i1.p1 TRINITY_DN16605_c0_g1~~TRINITY_DN16605_c0_g1_i1.p1  ORF type:complete len:129 (+),score=23.76 TRINITY_DN16605_c0_g1_i1:60-389(+)